MTKSINKYLALVVGEKCQQWRGSYMFIVLMTPFFVFSQENKKKWKAELVSYCGHHLNNYNCNIASSILVNIVDSNNRVLDVLNPSYRAMLIRNNQIIIDIKQKNYLFPDIINETAVAGDICIVMNAKIKGGKYKQLKSSVLVLYPKYTNSNAPK